MKKIIDVMWFTESQGTLGIVKADDEYNGVRYFIGSCSGVHEETDKEHIADWGAKFPKAAGDALFKEM